VSPSAEFHDRLRRTTGHRRPAVVGRRENSTCKGHSIQIDVEIAVRCGFDARDALDGAERSGELLRNRARRFAQAPGQLEGNRRREVAELALGRIFNWQMRQRVRR